MPRARVADGYGPVVRDVRRHRALPPRPEVDLSAGLCVSLPPEVADRYLQADAHRDPFAYATAQTMCGRCPVQLECLTDAIARQVGHTQRSGTRGGVNSTTIYAAAWRVRRERVSPAQVAREILARWSAPLVGRYGASELRRGHMADHLPMTEDR